MSEGTVWQGGIDWSAQWQSRAEAAEASLVEMTRRRDEWKFKAEGYDAIRTALREKVGAPWPPKMSRLLWAGIAADEKKRADNAEAELAALRASTLQALGEEYALDHVLEGTDERIGRHSAVRGVAVRLGIYPQLDAAIGAVIRAIGDAS